MKNLIFIFVSIFSAIVAAADVPNQIRNSTIDNIPRRSRLIATNDFYIPARDSSISLIPVIGCYIVFDDFDRARTVPKGAALWVGSTTADIHPWLVDTFRVELTNKEGSRVGEVSCNCRDTQYNECPSIGGLHDALTNFGLRLKISAPLILN